MQTELDRIANQNHLQLFKALIPHLPAPHRKRFSVMIKIMELQNVMRFYNRPRAGDCTKHCSADGIPGGSSCTAYETMPGGNSCDASCSPPPDASEEFSPEPPDLLDVLADVRCYCEGEEQQMIDQALQMMSMVELFSVMAQDGDAPGGGTCSPDDPPPEGEDHGPAASTPEGEDHSPAASTPEGEDHGFRKGEDYYE